MTDSREDRREKREEKDHYYSCAFCHTDSPKPFRVCESCGHAQPEEGEEE